MCEHHNDPNVHICGIPHAVEVFEYNGRKYTMEFHNYLGPSWFNKNDKPLFKLPKAVWKMFEQWHKNWELQKEIDKDENFDT